MRVELKDQTSVGSQPTVIVPAAKRFSGLPPDISALNELRQLPQWVAWRYEMRNGKPTKPPIDPHTGRGASSSDPTTWGTYEQAANRAAKDGLSGVGFVLSKDDGLTGYDLDKCRNPQTGKLKPWARDILAHSETYAEVSPSGRGVRLIARGKIPAAVKYDPARVEMYGDERYLTITGQRLEGAPDTIGEAKRTKSACQDRAEVHRRTWAALKRVSNSITRDVLVGKAEVPKRTAATLNFKALSR